MAENTTRPPTPVGWSDTDWIKHLQERKESHPLAGLHINQGSMDAAADAYEAEYNAAQEARNFRPRLLQPGELICELYTADQLAAAVADAVAAERERCAQVCLELAAHWLGDPVLASMADGAEDCAVAIREGQEKE